MLDIFSVWLYFYTAKTQTPSLFLPEKLSGPIMCPGRENTQEVLSSYEGVAMEKIPFLDQIPFPALSIGGLVIVVFFVMLFAKPLGKMVKLLLHAVLGFVLLFAMNLFVPVDALHLDINVANCIVAGVGGVPGIILLLICQYFFHV